MCFSPSSWVSFSARSSGNLRKVYDWVPTMNPANGSRSALAGAAASRPASAAAPATAEAFRNSRRPSGCGRGMGRLRGVGRLALEPGWYSGLGRPGTPDAGRENGEARGLAAGFGTSGAGRLLLRRDEQLVDRLVGQLVLTVGGVDHQGGAARGDPDEVVAEPEDVLHLRVLLQ